MLLLQKLHPESLSLQRLKPGEMGCEGTACIRDAEVKPPWWRRPSVGETTEEAGNHRSRRGGSGRRLGGEGGRWEVKIGRIR